MMLRIPNSHHEFIILVQSLIGKIEEERESRFFIDIGHLGLMLTGENIVKGLEESADLVFVGLCPREYYYGLTKIEGWACCRFFNLEFIMFGNISQELLSKEITLQAFVHAGIHPHVNKPPKAS